jgi:hypothetical protein
MQEQSKYCDPTERALPLRVLAARVPNLQELIRMPLSPDQEVICKRLEKGEPDPGAATLIRQQAQEIDNLWDRLSRAYALVRNESPAETMQVEIELLRAMLCERQSSQPKKAD